MTRRLDDVFARGRALVTYIMAGDGGADASLQAMRDLVAGGADILEVGMPFSDPMADGPIIQAAALRALQGGMTLCRTLDLVTDFRAGDKNTPVVLMGYANPIMQYGYKPFALDTARAGADGVIVVDLPPEEDAELKPHLDAAGVSLIRLITPTTDAARLKILTAGAGGFLYYVSMTGVTGTKAIDAASVTAHLETLLAHTDLPFVIGFGIKTPDDARAVAPLASGVVVGSGIVEKQARGDALAPYIAALKQAVKEAA